MQASDYVHRYVQAGGQVRYVVAELRGYLYTPCQSPAPYNTRPGIMSGFWGTLAEIAPYTYHYARRADALRRAREVYGTEDAGDE